jgi:hypothetical protein
MTKLPRKGTFRIAGSRTAPPDHSDTAPSENSTTSLTVVSSRGRGSVSISSFDFIQDDIPLIACNAGAIRSKLLSNKAAASLKTEEDNFSALRRVIFHGMRTLFEG